MLGGKRGQKAACRTRQVEPHRVVASFVSFATTQSVKEVSQTCELFGIIGEKENRREEKWNSGSRITGETW